MSRVSAARNLGRYLVRGVWVVSVLALVCAGWSPASAGQVPDSANVTYSKHVAPIILSQCSTCHRPEGAGPFSLLTYADTRPRARLIAAVTAKRLMPPWKPEHGVGDFVGERRLSDAQIRLIQDWVDQGAAEGDRNDLPPAPGWSDGWQLGQPDLVIKMSEPYMLGESGADVLRYFVMSIPVDRRQFVKGIEFRPGTRAVHHATMRIDPTQGSRRLDDEDPEPGYKGIRTSDANYPDGHFLAWTPGQLRPLAEDGLQWRLEPGTDLLLHLHLQPTGRPESIQPSIGFFFTDVPPTRTAVVVRLTRQDLDIPPGEREYVAEDRFVLPVDVELRELQPHAHLLARRVEGVAELPDGTTRPLIKINDWDFRWQDVYRLKTPLNLPAGTTLRMRIAYDNTSENVRNPFNPPQRVRHGENSSDEMGDLWLQVLPRSRENLRALQLDVRQKQLNDDTIGYRHMLEAYPDDAGTHDGLASLYLQHGRDSEALELFEKSVRLNPERALGHYNLGTTLLFQGRLPDAKVRFEEALRLKPDLIYAQNSLGYVLQWEGRIGEAIDHYRQALKTAPDYANARNNLGVALREAGLLDEALKEFEEAARLRPYDPVPQRNWAHALVVQGRPRDAISRFQAALQVVPDSPALLGDFALLLAAHPDASVRAVEQSVRLAERAAALTANQDPHILDVLSVACAAASQFERAVAVARSALLLATQRGARQLVEQIGARLRLFEARRSYVHDFAADFGR